MSKRKNNMMQTLYSCIFTAVSLSSIYVYFATYNYIYSIALFISGIVLMILIIIISKYIYNKKLLNSGMNIVDKMSGEQFEEFLLIHFKNLGYKGYTTPVTNDYGADLVVKKDRKRIVIQAKRWQSKVKIEAVQQISAAIQYYKANKGMVITNSFFTKNAVELARANNIELWDRNKLIEVMNKSNGKSIAHESVVKYTTKKLCKEYSSYSRIVNSENKICPRCGNKLILRTGKNGRFYGCSNYPECKYTQDI
ncbi:MAG: restriction endonuclease [Clostridium tyrobutyricum]|uniref:restriction endonuclease n=1 Tax=Clostridium tyrobutyricum TaxID=1519 RepID=UPI002431DAC2|nr:restriction endonuclease [Clostridium tyrobutyricum]MCH4200549.1 restriction endonuclease [Clostridium tyrobutyricum]MCH4237603.1 restriction endonuclease [Clostridium tyrobutyricum]MCH4259686.1 restriction endonuclease [Clostridium tyrobutyricum]